MEEAPQTTRPADPLRVVKVVVSVAALAWLVTHLDVVRLVRALEQLPARHFVAAELAVCASMAVGALRHLALLRAYGAVRSPGFGRCLRLYWVGFFYNTFLPGSVGGDLLRAVDAREAFGSEGAVASLAVVFVERLLGLAALVLVAGGAFVLRPLPTVSGLAGIVALGTVGAALGVCVVAVGRRIAHRLPGALGRAFSRLPVLVSGPSFAAAFGWSLASQCLVSLTGHALISGLDPTVPLVSSCVVVPVGAAAAYFPLSISGLGVREAAFAALYRSAGVNADAAVAFAVAFLAVQWIGALAGGLIAAASARRPRTA